MVDIEKVFCTGYLDHTEVLIVWDCIHRRRTWSRRQQSLKEVELIRKTAARWCKEQLFC